MQLDEQRVTGDDDDNDADNGAAAKDRELAVKDLVAAFDHIEAACNIFEKSDLLRDRLAKVARMLHDSISCYK